MVLGHPADDAGAWRRVFGHLSVAFVHPAGNTLFLCFETAADKAAALALDRRRGVFVAGDAIAVTAVSDAELAAAGFRADAAGSGWGGGELGESMASFASGPDLSLTHSRTPFALASPAASDFRASMRSRSQPSTRANSLARALAESAVVPGAGTRVGQSSVAMLPSGRARFAGLLLEDDGDQGPAVHGLLPAPDVREARLAQALRDADDEDAEDRRETESYLVGAKSRRDICGWILRLTDLLFRW
jgi:hypothetical protein